MRGLRAFESVARHLSILLAAGELNVTPGAVSRQIQALEDELGVALFRRGHRRLELTRAGHEFLAGIRTPLARITAAAEQARQSADQGTVSLCAYPTFAIRWFIPRWGRFYDQHPGIDIRLTTSLAPADFTRGDHDMAIEVLDRGELATGLGTHRLVDVETSPVCAPQLARQLRGPSDLRSLTLLHSEPRPLDWQRWFESVGARNVEARHGLRFESLNLAFQAAIDGLGVAIGIVALIKDDLASGRLVLPFPEMRRASRPMQLVYPASNARHASFRTFRDWLLAEAQR